MPATTARYGPGRRTHVRADGEAEADDLAHGEGKGDGGGRSTHYELVL